MRKKASLRLLPFICPNFFHGHFSPLHHHYFQHSFLSLLWAVFNRPPPVSTPLVLKWFPLCFSAVRTSTGSPAESSDLLSINVCAIIKGNRLVFFPHKFLGEQRGTLPEHHQWWMLWCHPALNSTICCGSISTCKSVCNSTAIFGGLFTSNCFCFVFQSSGLCLTSLYCRSQCFIGQWTMAAGCFLSALCLSARLTVCLPAHL